MNDFMKVSPLKILEMSSKKELGRGNLGVLIARAGVGKTACLIHIAFDKLFRKEKLVHISLEDGPEKVTSYYNVIFYDLVKALNMDNESEIRMILERNRMILAYLNESFEIKRLKENLKNLIEHIDFTPDTLIVDGLDFEKAGRKIFEDRHIVDVNEKGIPYPCNLLDDLFNIIIQLQPTQSGISLRLLKDHDNQVSSDASIRLDPNTFLASA